MSVIRKKYPIVDENGQSCTFPTFAGQVFGDGENPRALWQPGRGFYADDSQKLGGADADAYALKTDAAPDSEKLGGNPPEYYMPDYGREKRCGRAAGRADRSPCPARTTICSTESA